MSRSDVYRRLARTLDRLPQGFPATPEGIELEILRRIYSPEDAEMALELRPFPETAAAIARRLGEPEETVRRRLEAMVDRGQIGGLVFRGRRCYCLLPFVVGIYEMQLPRLDRELAELFEAYGPYLARALGGHPPGLARVVPVSRRLDARATVLATDDLRRMLERARSFEVADCICRREKELLGEPCTHTMETCLAFSPEPDAYDGRPRGGRVISRDEAMALLDAAEEEGLVHCTYNVERAQMFVCNCCSCCCGFLRLLTEHHTPHGLVRSNWVATVAADECAACGLCADTRCPVEAIVPADDGEAYRVLPHRCIGCGVCTVTCPTGAVRLEPRPPHERTVPPRDIVEWSVERIRSRFPVRGAILKGWLAWHRAVSRDR